MKFPRRDRKHYRANHHEIILRMNLWVQTISANSKTLTTFKTNRHTYWPYMTLPIHIQTFQQILNIRKYLTHLYIWETHTNNTNWQITHSYLHSSNTHWIYTNTEQANILKTYLPTTHTNSFHTQTLNTHSHCLHISLQYHLLIKYKHT